MNYKPQNAGNLININALLALKRQRKPMLKRRTL